MPERLMRLVDVPWLTQVPSDWEVRRLRTLADIRTGARDTQDRKDDGPYPFYVRSQKVERIDSWSYAGEAVLTAGDGAGVGKVFHYATGKFDFHQRAYSFTNFREILGRYFFYYFSTHLSYETSAGTAKSTVDSLRRPMLQNFPVPIPSLHEQELIVRYLDHAELRIAKAIAAKQQMIALLDEREELALLKAITQSNSSKTTDPRLDWLGEFPAHWEVKRLGALLEERNEMNSDRQIQQVLSLVRKRGVMRYEDKGRIGNKRSDDVGRYKIVREGDIVVNSMNVIIGSVGQSAHTGCLSPVYYVLKARSNGHHNAFFNAIFQVERFHSSLVRFGKGILAHRMRIPMIDLKTVMLPVPPFEEQLLIAERVVESTGELRAARSSIESEIGLLKEYRTRLISDVVTGKLDVRAEAAKLPVIDPDELVEVIAGAGLTAEDDGDDE